MAFVTVQGSVGRVFYEGKGAEIVESWKGRDGQDMSKRWSAFFDQPHGLNEGDQVKVSGMHSDKVDEWTDKEGKPRVSVKRAINKARMDGNPPAVESAPVDVWNQPTSFDQETPF